VRAARAIAIALAFLGAGGPVRAAAEAAAPGAPSAPPATAAVAAARLEVTAEPREIHVGDPIHLTLRLAAPAGSDLAIERPAAGPGDVEILSWGAPQETRGPAGERTVVVEATATAWRTGDVAIPALAARGALSGEVRSEPVSITVASVGIDSSQDIRPIKDPLSLPIEWGRIALIALAALATAVVAFLVARRLRRRPAERPAPALPSRPADEIALEALDRLASDGLVARGRTLEHYVRLADILRRYFEARFGFPALDRTTSEILVALRRPIDRAGVRRSIDTHAEIAGLLEEADLVKFAEHVPDSEDAAASVGRARRIVEATREEEAPPLAAAS
jgi:hypothetical protein